MNKINILILSSKGVVEISLSVNDIIVGITN